MFALTYGCTDYLGTVAATWLEYAVGKRAEAFRPLPFAKGMTFPETVGGGDMRYDSTKLRAAITEEPAGTRLTAQGVLGNGQTIEADILVERPRGHETLNVVIPWSDHSFQFTSKQNTRPAVGFVRVAGREFRFDHTNHAFGVLDYGRGVWPFQSVWNWGAASGWQDGLLVGLNLGGKWTDGTGMTESGLCIDGRLHKISEPLIWAYDRRDFRKPWKIYAPVTKRVDLELTPEIYETQRIELGLVGTQLHWVLGRFNGIVVTDRGTTVEVRDLLGWGEEHTARW